MKEQIKELKKKQEFHKEEARKYADAIEALRKICDHSWVYDGHGHNCSYYTCSVCGETEER